MNQTHHPFGDPAATQYHRRDELLAELQRRETWPPGVGRAPDPLAPVSGEIAVPARRGWTVAAVILLVAALVACVVVAVA